MEIHAQLSPLLADRALAHACPSVAAAQGRPDIAREATAKLLADPCNEVVFRFASKEDRRQSALVAMHDGQRYIRARDLRVMRPVNYAVRLKTKTKVVQGSLYDVIRHGEAAGRCGGVWANIKQRADSAVFPPQSGRRGPAWTRRPSSGRCWTSWPRRATPWAPPSWAAWPRPSGGSAALLGGWG